MNSSNFLRFIKNKLFFVQNLNFQEKINGAKRRIIFASLYLGNGPKEKELVELFDQVLGKSPKLEVKMLFDYFRGTRKETGKNNTIEMLDPVISRSEVEQIVYTKVGLKCDCIFRCIFTGHLTR